MPMSAFCLTRSLLLNAASRKMDVNTTAWNEHERVRVIEQDNNILAIQTELLNP